MPYVKTTWVPHVTPVSAENFNNMEQGIEDLDLNKVTKSESNNAELYLNGQNEFVNVKNCIALPRTITSGTVLEICNQIISLSPVNNIKYIGRVSFTDIVDQNKNLTNVLTTFNILNYSENNTSHNIIELQVYKANCIYIGLYYNNTWQGWKCLSTNDFTNADRLKVTTTLQASIDAEISARIAKCDKLTDDVLNLETQLALYQYTRQQIVAMYLDDYSAYIDQVATVENYPSCNRKTYEYLRVSPKWTWLKQWIISCRSNCETREQRLQEFLNGDETYWAYEMQAFLGETYKTSYPGSADYTQDNYANGWRPPITLEILQEEMENKVDKVLGKQLSTNDYTTQEKNKLANIENNAQLNIIEGIQINGVDKQLTNKKYNLTRNDIATLIGEATISLNGLFSAEDKVKLNTLYALLSNDDSDNVVNTIQEVLNIFNQYPEGVNLINTLSNKVDKVTGKGLSTNDYDNEEKNKVAISRRLSRPLKIGDNLRNKTIVFNANNTPRFWNFQIDFNDNDFMCGDCSLTDVVINDNITTFIDTEEGNGLLRDSFTFPNDKDYIINNDATGLDSVIGFINVIEDQQDAFMSTILDIFFRLNACNNRADNARLLRRHIKEGDNLRDKTIYFDTSYIANENELDPDAIAITDEFDNYIAISCDYCELSGGSKMDLYIYNYTTNQKYAQITNPDTHEWAMNSYHLSSGTDLIVTAVNKQLDFITVEMDQQDIINDLLISKAYLYGLFDSNGQFKMDYIPNHLDDVINFEKQVTGSDYLTAALTVPIGKLAFCAASVSVAGTDKNKFLKNTNGTIEGIERIVPQEGILYVGKTDNNIFAWSGSNLVEISKALSLGETSTKAYPGNKGKANADNIALLQNKIDVLQNKINEISVPIKVGMNLKGKTITFCTSEEWEEHNNKSFNIIFANGREIESPNMVYESRGLCYYNPTEMDPTTERYRLYTLFADDCQMFYTTFTFADDVDLIVASIYNQTNLNKVINKLVDSSDLSNIQSDTPKTKTVTISPSDWVANTYSIILNGIVISNEDVLMISPSDDTALTYYNSNITRTNTTNTILLTAVNTPTNIITLNIVYMKGQAM